MRAVRYGLALALTLAASCSPAYSGPPRTMSELGDRTRDAFKLVSGTSEVVVGERRLVFGLFDDDNRIARDLDLDLWYGRGPDDRPRGPVKVTFEDEGLEERPFYRAEVPFDAAGEWIFLVTDGEGGAGGQVVVKKEGSVPAPGGKAVSVPSPTFDDHRGVPDICTREPQDPMHAISLHDALKNKKPTVVVFGTPAFCASQICGPVVEHVLAVRRKHAGDANFIHIEPYSDPQVQPPVLAPAFAAWGLPSEPWVYVIDASGVVRARFEGPVVAREIEEALGPLI